MTARKQDGPGSAALRRSDAYDLHIGKRVMLLRRARNMRQAALADKLGITAQQLQKYEKGSNRIAAGRLLEIATILDVSIAFFYEGIRGTMAPVPTPPVRNLARVAALFAQIESEATRDEVVRLLQTLADRD